jgi:hypothetical protein
MVRIPDDLPVHDLRHGDGLVLVRMSRSRCARCGGQARQALGSCCVSSMTTRSNTMFSGVFPGTEEARDVLGFEAATTLDEMLDEVIAWIDEAIKNGTI